MGALLRNRQAPSLANRMGVGVCMLKFALSFVGTFCGTLWPYGIIAGFIVYSKIHGIH